MLKIIRKYAVVSTCLAVIAASLTVLVLFGSIMPVAMIAFVLLLLACLVIQIIWNGKVYGAKANSTIYRPGADTDS